VIIPLHFLGTPHLTTDANMLTVGNGCNAKFLPAFSQDSMALDNDMNTILENLKRFGKHE
jgi:hypothetical protein